MSASGTLSWHEQSIRWLLPWRHVSFEFNSAAIYHVMKPRQLPELTQPGTAGTKNLPGNPKLEVRNSKPSGLVHLNLFRISKFEFRI
jgi:hypothetical protein